MSVTAGAARRPAEGGVARRLQLLGVAEHVVDLGHGGELRSGAICAAQPVTMMRAPGFSRRCLADRLARLALGLGGDGAGVDDDGVAQARRARLGAHHLGFVGVEAAAEGDDLDRVMVADVIHGQMASGDCDARRRAATGR